MLDLKLKQKAIRLRRQGKTYTEIQAAIKYPLPQSTLSYWFKSIELTKFEKNFIWQKIIKRSELGHRKGGWTNHQKRLNRIAKIQAGAEKEFSIRCKNDPYFLAGLMLYLAEGTKKFERFQFMNSDPYLGKFMLNWIQKVDPTAKIKIRLYLHRLYEKEECEKYWAKFLDIPLENFYRSVYKITPHTVKKNSSYKGCARIEVMGSELFWKILKWRDMLYENI